ncbi:hypothetical protein KCP91_18025, partial [Microvirga sp. SRT01]
PSPLTSRQVNQTAGTTASQPFSTQSGDSSRSAMPGWDLPVRSRKRPQHRSYTGKIVPLT